MSNNKIITGAISAVLAMSLANIGHAADASMEMPSNIKGMEKCYGIAKAGMNDCATAGTDKHNCGGEAKIDRDPKSWLFVPEGLCKKIAGGSIDKPKA